MIETTEEIRGLEETARFFSVTAPTVRDWIRKGCPVDQVGGNGVPYCLDLRKVAAWRREQSEADARAAQDRAERDAQLKLELLGGDMLPDGDGPMTTAQRQQWLRAEIDKIRIAKERGELVNAAALRDAFVEPLALLRERLRNLPVVMARRFGWDDEVETVALEQIDDALTDLVDGIAAQFDDGNRDVRAA